MKKMPQRSRSHQIEEESRQIFISALPSTWVTRLVYPDYGIDIEVEIFDKDGNATGNKFYVQLKGTDTESPNRYTVYIDPETVNYFETQEYPVLIVRYLSAKQKMLIRWFHSIDPLLNTTKAGKLSIKYVESDTFCDETIDFIQDSIANFRYVKSSLPSSVLKFNVRMENDNFHGLRKIHILNELRAVAASVSNVIRLSVNNSYCHYMLNEIHISSDCISITMCGFYGFSLHAKLDIDGISENVLASDIMVIIGLTMDRYGRSSEGSVIINQVINNSEFARGYQPAFYISRCFARSNMVGNALAVSEVFFRNEESINAAQIYLLPYFANYRNISNSEQEYGFQVISRIAMLMESDGQNAVAGSMYYNCGSLLRVLSRYKDAIHYYRKAAVTDIEYCSRPYFLAEVAGVLFICNKFNLSCLFYDKSLSIMFDRDISLRYADSLMFSGDYCSALKVFEDNLSQDNFNSDMEWELKRGMLSWVIENVRIERQNRRSIVIDESFTIDFSDPGRLENMLIDFMHIDCLDPRVWRIYSQLQYHNSNHEDVVVMSVFACITDHHNINQWVITTCLLFEFEEMVSLLAMVLCVAYEIHGDIFHSELCNYLLRENIDVNDSISSFFDELPRREETFVIRPHIR